MPNDKKPRAPTPTQRGLLAAVKHEGVERRCYRAHYPGGVTMTWRWVSRVSEHSFAERVIRACEQNGWITVVRGELKPGVPPNTDPLRVAMGDLRLPDTLAIVAPGDSDADPR